MIKRETIKKFLVCMISIFCISNTLQVMASNDEEQESNSYLSEIEIEQVHEYNRQLETGYRASLGMFSKAVKSTWAVIPTKHSGVVHVRSGSTVPGTTKYYTRLLQACLNKLGFNAGDVDGVYGPNTERAIRKFQSANSATLEVDGVAGENTWRIIDIRIDSIYPSLVDF